MSRPSLPATRLTLQPWLRPVRRDREAVQLGLSAEAGGVILLGLTPAEIALLERLDGSLTEPDAYTAAEDWGVDPDRLDELLALLRERGMLRSERRLSRHRVVVDGTGGLAEAVARLLRGSGVGKVDLGPWAAAVAEAELRTGAPPPALVVHLAAGAVDPRAGDTWHRYGIPQLPVAGDGRRFVVGPVVGPDARLPCLRCLQLARVERDAAWPRVVAQSAMRPADAGSDGPLLALAAGVVAMVALAVVTGAPLPAGVSVEVRTPWPRMDHRRWHRHPGCEAHGEDTEQPPAQPPTAASAAQVTMTG